MTFSTVESVSNWLGTKLRAVRRPTGSLSVVSAAEMRPMRESDLAVVLAIERGAYPFPWSQGIFRDCLRVGYCCWVIETTAAPQGYGIMSVGAGECHILNLCIRPQSQRQGLGRTLLSHLLGVARSHHALTAMLEVRPSNEPALRLYQDMGFNEVGVRRAYYPRAGGREDALILATELCPS